jgi:hypothetical protein
MPIKPKTSTETQPMPLMLKRLWAATAILVILALIINYWPNPLMTKNQALIMNTELDPWYCDELIREHNPVDPNLFLCTAQGYIGVYVSDPNTCTEKGILKGTEITMAAINNIKELQGDSNHDGNCDQLDLPDFVQCLQQITSTDFNCFCAFDWNKDNEINLLDFAALQRSINTGNNY